MFPFALIFGAIGAVASVAGSFIQADAAHKQSVESKKQEHLRELQMNLESARQRRESIRNSLRARSLALVAGASQGASFSSGVAGGLSQVSNKNAENILGVNQANSIGQGIFRSNAKIAEYGAEAAFGGGLTTLGQTISGINIG